MSGGETGTLDVAAGKEPALELIEVFLGHSELLPDATVKVASVSGLHPYLLHGAEADMGGA